MGCWSNGVMGKRKKDDDLRIANIEFRSYCVGDDG